ncbi:MAG: N-acyl homoserine lactonase family protein [Candidatus Dormibacteraeota bacterium]|nr:N-acyl homoserine lactonase family protein [Candidatus Dormibacteraeota bacterium]
MEITRLHLATIGKFMGGAPVHGFVIHHPRAGAILVDTGVGYPDSLVAEWKIVNRTMAVAMAEHHLSPADVRIVINTHLHFDHCGQNAVFQHAPFYVQRAELERGRREESLTAALFDFAGARFELVDGDAVIAEGVRVIATPGHTAGHQCVVVDGENGEELLIGDAAYTSRIFHRHRDLDLGKVDGQAADAGQWHATMDRLHDLNAAAVHFCHDTEVVRRAGMEGIS